MNTENTQEEEETQVPKSGPGFDVVDTAIKMLPRILLLVVIIMIIYSVWSFLNSPVGSALSDLVGTLAAVIGELASKWWLLFIFALGPPALSLLGTLLASAGAPQAIAYYFKKSSIMGRYARDSPHYKQVRKEMEKTVKRWRNSTPKLTKKELTNALKDPSVINDEPYTSKFQGNDKALDQLKADVLQYANLISPMYLQITETEDKIAVAVEVEKLYNGLSKINLSIPASLIDARTIATTPFRPIGRG